jgi:hypothetical protein
MSFSAADYERAIARIYNRDDIVIGTGFLVAPGYVLTCAHVVLSAMGLQTEEDYRQHQAPPQEPLTLNFHLLDPLQKLQAQVVAWLPYDRETNDVAALRLLTPLPKPLPPVPLTAVSWLEVQKDQHSVYGFGESDGGGRTDAYRPKTSVAGNRFQLCKFGDEADETIQPGYSGAPVWNERLQQVIGMVATARVVQTKAQAITTQALRHPLNQVAALHLHDVLAQCLADCADHPEEKAGLERAIAIALQRCHPNRDEGKPVAQQLIALSDLPPIPGWEAEGRLVYFAVLLAWLEDTPAAAYNVLETWVRGRNLSFGDLLARLTKAMKQQQVSAKQGCEHLMVGIEPDETSDDQWRVSMWAIADLAQYTPKRPPLPVVKDETLTLTDIPELIRRALRNFPPQPVPTIHLFVPRTLFAQGIEMFPSSRRTTLGSEYPCVLRTNLKTHPSDRYCYETWQNKWTDLEPNWGTPAVDVLADLDGEQNEDDLFDALEMMPAAIVQNSGDIGDLFDLIAEETALPIALWSRRNDPQQDKFGDILNCVLQTLPQQVHQARRSAHRAKNDDALGQHLSLLWEDPRIVPPDMQFDPDGWTL